jgi:2'-5' RNA ligase
VIWVGTQQGGQQCASLADRVAKALVPCGFEPDKRPFQAHLTLGRVKKGARDLWTQYLEYLNSIEWPEITLDSFVLWKSELKPHGPVYEVIQKYPLSERDSG